MVATNLIADGNAALKSGEWGEATRTFRAAAVEADSTEAWWGLGMAGFIGSDGAAAFEGFERAYQGYRDAGDQRNAAMAAMFLANSTFDFRGEPAVASGWLLRAERLLDGLESGAEHAWLDIWMGNLALMVDNDVARAEELASRAASIARQVGDLNAEMLAVSLRGLALVSRGDMAGGMAQLDEAATAAIAGDLDDPNAGFMTVCNLIEACSRVFDYERAAQWCSRVRDYCGDRNLAPWYNVCRPNYARVLVWRGDWAGAEVELNETALALAELRPPLVAESLVRLAELRVRQGRLDEAAELFRRTETDALSLPGRAWLAFELGDVVAAADLAERFLRSRPAEDRSAAAQIYEVLVRAALDTGDLERAEAVAYRMSLMAELIATAPVRAAASY
ncbi:MAG: tetratricopeptide repeat protein, partial [Dehalococcoidia bacterium]